MRIAAETIARAEDSFELREGLRVMPHGGDEKLRNQYRRQMKGFMDEIEPLIGKPFVPNERWSYATNEFPSEATRYWNRAQQLAILDALDIGEYREAASRLKKSITLSQQLKAHGDFGITSGQNLGIARYLSAVGTFFDDIPDGACKLFYDVLSDLDQGFPSTDMSIDAEEAFRLEFYRGLQTSGGGGIAGAYMDFRATARRMKVYFDKLREEHEKPVLLRVQPERVGGPLDIDDTFLQTGIDPSLNDFSRCNIRLLAAAFAVRIYRAKYGKLPDRLSEAYGGVDPYTGKEFIYKRLEDGWQVYSPGLNGIDDGGVPVTLPGSGRDVTVAMYRSGKKNSQPVILR